MRMLDITNVVRNAEAPGLPEGIRICLDLDDLHYQILRARRNRTLRRRDGALQILIARSVPELTLAGSWPDRRIEIKKEAFLPSERTSPPGLGAPGSEAPRSGGDDLSTKGLSRLLNKAFGR